MADALPRERWMLTVVVLFVVLGGLFPNAIVRLAPIGSDATEQDRARIGPRAVRSLPRQFRK
jgi:hypothetical protein